MLRKQLAVAMCVMAAGCYHGVDTPSQDSDDAPPTGAGSDGDGEDPSRDPPDPAEPDVDPSTFADLVGVSGARRLTSIEYAATVSDLIGDDTLEAVALLPEDTRTPFDNDFTLQVASQALIEGAELLAADAGGRLLDDPNRLAQLIGCTPTGPDDADCFAEFVSTFGRSAFRRPLSPEEHAVFASLLDLGVQADDFNVGAVAVVRAFLQHPNFLYRIELGTPVPKAPGLFALDGFEIASRLSYLLTGSMPSDDLLDAAENGNLDGSAGIRDAAQKLLQDPRARARVARFHALWIGYEALPFGGDLGAAMRAETDALIERVIFDEERPWQDLLRMPETYVDASLAQLYGLPPPVEPSWVAYGNTGRQGLLSQASFLSSGTDGLTTSPVQRGLLVRTRLFCEEIEVPLDVDVDEPIAPEDAVCKVDILAAHAQGGCATCHQLMDPIGFGLENYGPDGAFRVTEPDLPQCEIEGKGTVAGIGDFSGPAELADLLLTTGSLGECVATQLYRFAMGRYELEDYDASFIEALTEELGDGDFGFGELVVEMAGTPAFRHRREEEVG